MTSIKNVRPLSPESIFDLLKKEFSTYVNAALSSNLSIEYAHVYDVINIMFPEIIEGTVFTLIVSDEAVEVSDNATNYDYNTELLEEQLIEFLKVHIG